MPVAHVAAGPHDRALCAAPFSAPGAIPRAASLARQQLREDRGLEALLILSGQIDATTAHSDRVLKC